MKVLGIVAGRHNGNSEILVKEALSVCKDAGAECTLINLFDYNILACQGCEACTMAMGLGKDAGCILDNKDDMDKIVHVMQQQDAIILGVPTYDLLPSATYLTFGQRFLAYEISFRLKIGSVKKDPHLIAGVIACGGSCRDWQTMTLEAIGATMFTQSIKVVDQMLATRNGRPGNVLLRPEQLERAHKLGENIIKSIQTPFEQREWLGDPDTGMCPNCHSNLVMKGEPHWDGLEFPFECPVCGAGGDLVKGEDGRTRFVLAENGLIRDRNVNEFRELHLTEIIETKIDFFQRQDSIQEQYKHYKDMAFPAI
ncbi:flavodoxin family protein [Parasporobacterium paucivorans]|uniref:Multimeric flavodoxin WrbA n=1 Tax=Parasporobacterium paucivorans DSM 15970 TaxID=1122934 RepID=A0A1M6LMV8_9FIRM|nr:flavodoxin family protein [Parasporobacterium paucivorans]SHJ72493.1 Multimeric flavodoxin WrbA [Parasporobacterium paucivorans DSM 15970]